MNPKLAQSLQEAIQETFENMAFLETVPASEDIDTLPADAMAARLAITAPVSGTVHLVLPAALLRSMGEVLLAVPADELDREALQDLHFELVNTVVGMLLNRFLPEDQAYSLGLPESESASRFPNGRQSWFLVDDRPVLAALEGKILTLVDP